MKIKAVLTLLIFLVEVSPSFARTCASENESILVCQYYGETGLELIEDPKLHQIQRLPVYLGDSLGSIVLVRNAFVDGLKYTECWSTATTEDELLTLYCSQVQSSNGEIPTLILSEISRLKTN